MFTNTPTLQVYQENDFDIQNTVCAFLNTQGGHIICYDNGHFFASEDAANQQITEIKGLLKRSIIYYPTKLIKYKPNSIDNKYFIVIEVKKSSDFHYVKDGDQKKSYIRAEKTNKLYDFDKNIKKKNKAFGDGYYKIGNYPTGFRYYKYMAFDKALQCLRNRNLWFVEPSKWQDKYERYFYNAKINGKVCSEKNPIVYATCVTYKMDSESAWKIYSYNAYNSDSLCVQFYLNRPQLRKALVEAKYRTETNGIYNKKLSRKYDIYEGVVNYKGEQTVKNLPYPILSHDGEEVRNEWHHTYFDDFSLNKYLNLLLLKRNAFQHEQETRFFIVEKKFDPSQEKGKGTDDSEAKHLDIKLPWESILLGVRYDASIPSTNIEQLKEEVRKILNLKKREPFPKKFIFEPYDVYSAPNPPTIPSK